MFEEKIIKIFKSVLKNRDVKKYLLRLKKHHRDTYEHSIRVGLLCIYLGYENNLQEKEIKLLGYSGILHDIGKTSIHCEILSKKGKLSKQEFEKIKEHPRRGFIMLKNKKFSIIRRIIIGHHECVVNPYPRRNKDRRKNKRNERRAKKYSKLIQILSAADHYDALHNKRTYKEPLTCKKIKKVMEKQFKGKKIYVQQVFEKCLIENPLEAGEI